MSLRKAAEQKGIPVKVKTGSPGQFQVFRDSVKLFDYKEAGQNLPSTEELLGMITRPA